MKKVVVDILGGDNAPGAILNGTIMALKKNKELELVLVGDEEYIKPRVKAAKMESRVEIIHTTENIPCTESPTAAIRSRPNSSIVLGQTALKNREDCGAFVSAGSTGAVLTGGFMKVGRIEGVSRPTLCPLLPTKTGVPFTISDTGANMDCKPINLVHFALMANEFMKGLGIAKPNIALLNVGAEDEKGNELALATFPLLKKLGEDGVINFCGNTEAREAWSGNYNVAVSDGFSGNVLLKCMEGTGGMISHKLNKLVLGGIWGKVAKLFLARRLIKLRDAFAESTYAGAVFLGIKKPIIKSHGNSKPLTMCNAILFAARVAQMDLGEGIKNAVANFKAEE